MKPQGLSADPCDSEPPRLSVVIPVFNEQEVLPEFHRRLAFVMRELVDTWEAIYVNDGSTDRSPDVLQELAQRDEHVVIVELSRNFGKEIAMTAGLDYARGAGVVVIDADLQDPPEVIRDFVREWEASEVDVVYGKRRTRLGEAALKKLTASIFYRVIQRVGRVRIPEATGDFRLMSRRAVIALRRLREQHRFMKGLFAWIGFPQKAILYDRDPRFAGGSKFNYWKLWNFALEGITSFTTAPLKIATYFGLLVATLAFVFGVFIIYKTLIYGDPVAGYPSLIVVVLFLGGTQLLFIGVLGEYLGRMFDETKGRPLYVVKEHLAAGRGSAAARAALEEAAATARPSAYDVRNEDHASPPR
jgi:glycosyltransferase involved in cell wall biosynthesis